MSIDTGGRPASWGARFLRHWFVRFVILFVVLLALYIASTVTASLLDPPVNRVGPKPWIDVGVFLVAAPILIFVYSTLTTWLERRRPLAELDPAPAIPQLITGALLGLVLLSIVIGAIVVIGHGSIAIPATLTIPTFAFAISIISGVAEELLFRGVMFRIVEERWGTLIALIVSSVFFGAVHAANTNATLISSAAIALEAGFLLGLAYTATRTLWLPIGLHFGWNFTEGGVFTTAVSGGKIPGLLDTNLTGPDILTGGAFGPEASYVTVIVCLAAAAIFLRLTLRSGQWRAFTARNPALPMTN
jgi:membrane protease YdiL (CAAX protease family)